MAACNVVSEEGKPEEVISEYLNAVKNNNYSESYQYLSSEDKEQQSLEKYTASEGKFNDKLIQTLGLVGNTSFKILNSKKEGDSAIVNVELTIPDVASMVQSFMGLAFEKSLGDLSKVELSNKLKEYYQNTPAPTIIKMKSFVLKKEGSIWKVFLDIKGQQLKTEKQYKIFKLINEGNELKKENKLSDAIKKYEEVLSLDSESEDAKMELQETLQMLESEEEKTKYIQHLELYDFSAKYYDSYKGKIVGIYFKLKNNGDKSLDRVKVTVYFQDASGNIISENDYMPILVSEDNFTGDNKPLKPKYIWVLEEGKFYIAPKVPSEWEEGKAYAEITGITFSKQ